jgi:predicted nucleotidyltransferase
MWKLALNEFIQKYLKDDDVEAIMLVGSYAVENQNQYSDIDVYVILNDNAKYRERGNKLIDNYLIEYFVNPIHKVREYLEEDKRGHGGAMANMLLKGKIIFDRNNIVPVLREEALAAKDQIPEKDPMKYYACWHAFDEYLAAAYHNELQYYLCLKYLVDCYLANNGYCILPEQKIEKFFKDAEYRAKYDIGKFPDNEFNHLVIKCFDYPNRHNLQALYNFVIEDGKFDINNFVLRNKI